MFELVVVDNRGIGRSDAPSPPYSTRVMAADAIAVLDHAGIERAHVFGVSLGGMISQRIAIDHPSRVDRLVLGCTAARGRAATPLGATLALARGATMTLAQAMRHTAPWVCSPEFLARRPDVVESWIRIATEEPATRSGLVGQATAGLTHDAEAELARIAAPTMVITGDADRLIPARHSYALAARIAGAKLVVLRGAGHDFPTERPDETASHLRAFLLDHAKSH